MHRYQLIPFKQHRVQQISLVTHTPTGSESSKGAEIGAQASLGVLDRMAQAMEVTDSGLWEVGLPVPCTSAVKARPPKFIDKVFRWTAFIAHQHERSGEVRRLQARIGCC
ncbi:hypothetical protein O181_015776 [Austropuccinia psidii MF-1]|uniref:Uncharacterized protein n=1 Tax=Austropuccinia psidii MF-1 TaxID=1389203 RepID=A0A9Q3C4D4_9BASI|nr:hypothetical protein [Austropuccinia psidii MF-1]